jgi:solute carrier family 50 protein (sugar transporter)
MGTTDILVNTVCPAAGVVISNLMFLSPWKLVMTARKNRHLGNVNPIPFALMFITNLGYCVYGSMLSNYYIFFSAVFGVLLSLFYCITCLTIMAKEAFEDEFTDLYILLEGLVLGGLGFWAILGIVQTSLFHSYGPEQQHTEATQLIGYMCCFCNICYYAAPLSTMQAVIRHKDSSSLYLPNILVNCMNATLWLCYGAFGVKNMIVWGPSSIGLTLSLIQVSLVVMYHEGHWLEAVSGWATHGTIQVKTRVEDETYLTNAGDALQTAGETGGGGGASFKGDRERYNNELATKTRVRKSSFVVSPISDMSTAEEVVASSQSAKLGGGPARLRRHSSASGSVDYTEIGRKGSPSFTRIRKSSSTDNAVDNPLHGTGNENV